MLRSILPARTLRVMDPTRITPCWFELMGIDMRSWIVIPASVVLATSVTAFLYLPAGLPPSRAVLTALLYAQWPAIAVIWFSSYGVAALALTTAALAREIGQAGDLIAGSALESADLSLVRRQVWRDWVRRYLVWLAITQYFSAVLALLTIGFAGVPIDQPWFVSFFPLVANSPALAAADAVIVAGLLGTFAFYLPRVRSVSRLSIEKFELALLRQIFEILRNRAEDAAQIEQGQRSILGAIKDLATAVNRFSRSQRLIIQEIKNTVGPEALNQWVETAEAWPATIEQATSELRATVAALDISITRVAEVANSVPRDAASLSQLSTEFEKLLHDVGEMDQPANDPSS
jgi:methyl-accepting chemotaxis protein